MGFIGVFLFVFGVVGDDGLKGTCVDMLGRAVAVVQCPLVYGALEEVGAFRPYSAGGVFGVDDRHGGRVEA